MGNPALSKGPITTSWIWDLHATPHDFNLNSSSSDTSRKVIAASLAYFSVVGLWASGMLFHGAYYSNYTEWLVDPSHIRPSAQQVWSIFGQEILNSDLGGYFQGLYITSGLFPLWRAQGLISCTYLKAASATALTLSFFVLFLSFAIMHIYPLRTSSRLFLPYQVAILGGLASVLWAGHLFHISLPLNTLIDSGASPEFICSAQDLLSRDVLTEIFPNLSSTQLVALDLRNLSFSELSPSGCLPVQITIFHHLAL